MSGPQRIPRRGSPRTRCELGDLAELRGPERSRSGRPRASYRAAMMRRRALGRLLVLSGCGWWLIGVGTFSVWPVVGTLGLGMFVVFGVLAAACLGGAR